MAAVLPSIILHLTLIATPTLTLPPRTYFLLESHDSLKSSQKSNRRTFDNGLYRNSSKIGCTDGGLGESAKSGVSSNMSNQVGGGGLGGIEELEEEHSIWGKATNANAYANHSHNHTHSHSHNHSHKDMENQSSGGGRASTKSGKSSGKGSHRGVFSTFPGRRIVTLTNVNKT